MMFAVPSNQREDIFRLPITLSSNTAKKWIELRKEHGIGDQDFADLLMHRYEATAHLFVPVASSSGSSTTFTFNGPIGVGDSSPPKPVKKRGRPPKQNIIKVAEDSPTKKTAKKKDAPSPAPVASRKARSKSSSSKSKSVDQSEDESSDSDDSGSNVSDSDDSNTEGALSEDYNPSIESENESEGAVESPDEGLMEEEELKERKPKRRKYELEDEDGVYKCYDAKEVAKVEGVIPKLPTRPRAKLQRKYWASLTKQYQCKLCCFESPNPKLICQHLLQQHGENVTDLREYLLRKTVPDSEPELTLFSVVMAEKPPANANLPDVSKANPLAHGSEIISSGANPNFPMTAFERSFGLTRSEAAQTLANVAESLVTVAVNQGEENEGHVQQIYQRNPMVMGQLPADVAQAQLEFMQRQLDAAHGLTQPGLPLHMNLPENAFMGSHRQVPDIGVHPLLHQPYTTPIHPQPDVVQAHANVSHQPICESLTRPEGMMQGMEKGVTNGQHERAGQDQEDGAHSQAVIVQQERDLVQPLGGVSSPPQRDVPPPDGEMSDTIGLVSHSGEVRTNAEVKLEPEMRPHEGELNVEGENIEGEAGQKEGGNQTEAAVIETPTEPEEGETAISLEEGKDKEQQSNTTNQDAGPEKAEESSKPRTRSSSRRKAETPAPVKRGRGRPKGPDNAKKPALPPPEDHDPFHQVEFLQVLMKWVKIVVSCPTCGKSLHNLGVITKKGEKISHVCRTTEKKNESDLLCHLCGKSFVSGRGFKVHWQEYHGSMERAVCQFCGKVVKGSYLSQHIHRCHTETGITFQCAMCGKAFKSKSACDKHEAIHRTDKPFKCPYCQRGFSQQANMKHHMRQHTGEQPYRCETCAKSFTHNVSLKNHLKRQHGVDLWQMGHTGGGRPKKEKPVELVESKPYVN